MRRQGFFHSAQELVNVHDSRVNGVVLFADIISLEKTNPQAHLTRRLHAGQQTCRKSKRLAGKAGTSIDDVQQEDFVHTIPTSVEHRESTVYKIVHNYYLPYCSTWLAAPLPQHQLAREKLSDQATGFNSTEASTYTYMTEMESSCKVFIAN